MSDFSQQTRPTRRPRLPHAVLGSSMKPVRYNAIHSGPRGRASRKPTPRIHAMSADSFDNFEYEKASEHTSQAARRHYWAVAIGLQDVDGLSVSPPLPSRSVRRIRSGQRHAFRNRPAYPAVPQRGGARAPRRQLPDGVLRERAGNPPQHAVARGHGVHKPVREPRAHQEY